MPNSFKCYVFISSSIICVNLCSVFMKHMLNCFTVLLKLLVRHRAVLSTTFIITDSVSSSGFDEPRPTGQQVDHRQVPVRSCSKGLESVSHLDSVVRFSDAFLRVFWKWFCIRALVLLASQVRSL